jgi:hypothetical protein
MMHDELALHEQSSPRQVVVNCQLPVGASTRCDALITLGSTQARCTCGPQSAFVAVPDGHIHRHWTRTKSTVAQLQCTLSEHACPKRRRSIAPLLSLDSELDLDLDLDASPELRIDCGRTAVRWG